MTLENPIESGNTEGNPAVARLKLLSEDLQKCLEQNVGKNAEWERLVRNKISALAIAIQTIEKYEELPEGMTLKSLSESARKLIEEKP